MVNHWYDERLGATACAEYAGELARHVSTTDDSRVSCPECNRWLDDPPFVPSRNDDDLGVRNTDLATADMCPNCVTPWKCNGPHVPPLADEPLADWERELLDNFDPAVEVPEHYRWIPGIECIDVAQHFGYFLGNVIKYVWRADHKGKPIQDLEKALTYLQLELKRRRAEGLTDDAEAIRRTFLKDDG